MTDLDEIINDIHGFIIQKPVAAQRQGNSEERDQLFLKNIRERLTCRFPGVTEALKRVEFIQCVSQLFEEVIQKTYLQRREEALRGRAMQIIRYVILEFLTTLLNALAEPPQPASAELQDVCLTLLNDIIEELFRKVRDIYCVLDSLLIISEVIIPWWDAHKKGAYYDFMTEGLTKSLLTAISSPNLDTPQYNFKTRNAVYKIYQSFTFNQLYLKDRSGPTSFVKAVIAAFMGESDPRNLVIVFDLLHFVLLHFFQKESQASDFKIDAEEVEPMMEDIFDQISCYFPINFNPPKDDKFKITRHDLKAKLKSCFLATEHPLMVDKVLTFMIEKAGSSEDLSSKKEAMEIIEEIFYKIDHNSRVMEEHLQMTISLIQNEYYNQFDAETQVLMKISLARLLNIIERKSLYQNKHTNNQDLTSMMQRCSTKSEGDMPLSNYTEIVVDNCLHRINEDPSGIGAVLASRLLTEIIGNTTLPELAIRVFKRAFKNPTLVDKSILRNIKIQADILQTLDQPCLATGEEYQEATHSAYLQVLINIILAINGQNNEDRGDAAALTKLQRSNLKEAMGGVLFTFFNKDTQMDTSSTIRPSQNDMEEIIQAQLQVCLARIQIKNFTCNGVILEKNFKLYCSIASLIQSVIAEAKEKDFFKFENVGDNHVLNPAYFKRVITDMMPMFQVAVKEQLKEKQRAFFQVYLDGLSLITSSLQKINKDCNVKFSSPYQVETEALLVSNIKAPDSQFSLSLDFKEMIYQQNILVCEPSIKFAIDYLSSRLHNGPSMTDEGDSAPGIISVETQLRYLAQVGSISASELKQQLTDLVRIIKPSCESKRELELKKRCFKLFLSKSTESGEWLIPVLLKKAKEVEPQDALFFLRLLKFVIKYKAVSEPKREAGEQSMEVDKCGVHFSPVLGYLSELTALLAPDDDDSDLLCVISKLAFYITLRQPAAFQQSDCSKLNQLLNKGTVPINLFFYKAQVIRGDRNAYAQLVDFINTNFEYCPRTTDNDVSFVCKQGCRNIMMMAKIISKKVSPVVSKENGYKKLNRMYAQQMLTRLYPVVQEKYEMARNSNAGQAQMAESLAQVMMQLCSLVPLKILENQNKLGQLIPIAVQVLQRQTGGFHIPQFEWQGKMTAIQLFRKIILQFEESMRNEAKVQELLHKFIIILVGMLEQSQGSDPQALEAEQVKVAIECLFTFNEISSQYHPAQLMKFTPQIKKVVDPMLDHKKRVVRKFARNCLNQWLMM